MTDPYRAALQDIYDSARSPFTRICRWCEAPPPDGTHDHDVACPAAKAAYTLNLPGYGDWTVVADALAELGLK